MVDDATRPRDRDGRQACRRVPGVRWRRWRAPVAALALVLVPGIPTGAQEGGHDVVRVDGEDRYATAARVAEAFMPGVERVFLATGLDFPDALAAGPVAGAEGHPILLVEPGRIPAATAAALDRLAPDGITILGGTRAVSPTVQQQAQRYTEGVVDRLAGRDRYGTAAAIVDEHVDAGVPVAYVATGEHFADALAGVPAAVAAGGPVVLVARDRVPVPTRTTLQRLRPGRIVVLGGPEAVSLAVEQALEDLTDGAVDRLSGPDRYATAAAIAGEVFPGAQPTVYLATGLGFPDALAGGVVAGMEGAPLLTVDPRCVPDVALAQIRRMDPGTLVVLGGTAAVGEDAAALVACGQATEPVATTVQTGLAAPWDVVFTPDGRTFLTERDTGRVLERFPDRSMAEVRRFGVDNAGEGGLLGLAVSPTYAADGGDLYALYTRASDQVIVRFDPDEQGTETLVSGLPAHSFHDAGRIEFGPDGMLYVGMGDAGDADAAQDPTALAGSILRYTPEGGVPGDNPFGNPVWAYGLRDPQGLAWDADGRLYASEFGPDRDDEINRIVPGGNYGWPEVTGTDGGNPDYVDPLVVRQPGEASWSGASVLLDGSIPQWEGDLFVAALRGERLYRLDLDGSGGVAGVEELLVHQYGRLRHVTPAPDGSLWILTSNCDGRGACPTGADDRIIRLGP